MNCIESENLYGIQFCERQNVAIERGYGTEVWDQKGARYLDFTSGWGVTCLGHAHPVVITALTEQAGKVIQNPNSGFTYSPARARLLRVLKTVLPVHLERMFFLNSGAEANDLALKLARKITGKPRIVSTLGSFHGRTFNTLSVTGGPENVRRYTREQVATDFVPFGDFDALSGAVSDLTAAVILEPVQGEGGVRIATQEYLQEVASYCRKKNVLLVIDEIQTGFCRTGKVFALEHVGGGVKPDLLTMGKGIAGGFPFSALAVSAEVAQQVEKGDHGGTYCGNPLGCAVSAAVVQFLVDNRVAEQADFKGRQLLRGLQALQSRYPGLVRAVRGLGLLTALELTDDRWVSPLTLACQELGLLVTPTRNGIVRLIPDLLVSSAHIREALTVLDAALLRVAAAS